MSVVVLLRLMSTLLHRPTVHSALWTNSTHRKEKKYQPIGCLTFLQKLHTHVLYTNEFEPRKFHMFFCSRLGVQSILTRYSSTLVCDCRSSGFLIQESQIVLLQPRVYFLNPHQKGLMVMKTSSSIRGQARLLVKRCLYQNTPSLLPVVRPSGQLE